MNFKKRIKTVSIFLTIAMVSALAFSGCQLVTGSSSLSSSPTSSQTTTLDPYVIDYYFGGTAQTDQDMVETALNELVQPLINATVKLHCLDWGEAAETLKVKLSAGDKIDLVFTGFINPLNTLVSSGVYKELDELLPTYGQDILEQVPEGWWGATKYQGKIYAVPNIQYAVTTPGVMVRRDLAEKYNLDISTVTDLEALEPFLKAVKEGEQGIVPFCMYKTFGIGGSRYFGPHGIQVVQEFAGVNVDSDPYTLFSLFQDDLYLKCFETAHRWFEQGYIPADTATKTDVTAETKANLFAAIQGNVYPYSEQDNKATMGTDLITVPFTGHKGMMETGSITATMNSIGAASEDPERAMMFLNLLFSNKEIYRTLCSGIEGTHYTKVTEDIIQIAKDSKYVPGLDWEFGNSFNAYLNYGDPVDKFEVLKAGNESALSSPIMGFVFENTAVQTEEAQLTATCAEYFEGLSNGTLDPAEYYPKLVEELNAAGLDTYIAEIQKQLTAWKEANVK